MNCDTIGQSASWCIHINGATRLLELRGKDQFNRERGRHLFSQLRSQIASQNS